MNILITGLHGFVGSNLMNALKDQHLIYGIDVISPEVNGVVKTYSWIDIEHQNLPVVDVIIHLAGLAHDTKNKSKAQDYFDINTGLTKKIYDYFLSSTAGKFIFFSSVKAAADRVIGDVLTEEVVPVLKGPYGESKMAAERYILSNLPAQPAQSVYIIRPCMIHGPGNKGNLNLLYHVVNKSVPWPLGAFENHRSFTSVDNLSYVIEALISKDVPSGIYNMCDDEVLSTNELIELICRVTHRRCRIWNLPPSLIKCFAQVGSILHLPLNNDRLRKLTEDYLVSNEKIKKALGINKMPVSAISGFEKTIESFKK
ncbi:MAG: NAD-dependent epimerase/dehydratase family protein [Bacteroidales bacterium]|nr:NAD-dependent epimerase/dehydratase family protein [Bacteroidales bacterium]